MAAWADPSRAVEGGWAGAGLARLAGQETTRQDETDRGQASGDLRLHLGRTRTDDNKANGTGTKVVSSHCQA